MQSNPDPGGRNPKILNKTNTAEHFLYLKIRYRYMDAVENYWTDTYKIFICVFRSIHIHSFIGTLCLQGREEERKEWRKPPNQSRPHSLFKSERESEVTQPHRCNKFAVSLSRGTEEEEEEQIEVVLAPLFRFYFCVHLGYFCRESEIQVCRGCSWWAWRPIARRGEVRVPKSIIRRGWIWSCAACLFSYTTGHLVLHPHRSPPAALPTHSIYMYTYTHAHSKG